MITKKRKLAVIYHAGLDNRYIKPILQESVSDAFHIYNIRHPKRDLLKEYLRENEILTEIHYPVAPHRQAALKSTFGGSAYPVSDAIHETTLSLPVSVIHEEKDIQRVVEIMNAFPGL